MEARRAISREVSLFPEKMRARERGMPAKINFHDRREPAQTKLTAARNQKRRFRKVHFASNKLHPGIFRLFFQKTHCRRISRERPFREGVYLKDLESHDSPFLGRFPDA